MIEKEIGNLSGAKQRAVKPHAKSEPAEDKSPLTLLHALCRGVVTFIGLAGFSYMLNVSMSLTIPAATIASIIVLLRGVFPPVVTTTWEDIAEDLVKYNGSVELDAYKCDEESLISRDMRRSALDASYISVYGDSYKH